MLEAKFAVYLGKEKEGGFSGFIAEHNLFLIIEMEEGISLDQGHELLHKLKERVLATPVENLSSFDQFISHAITEFNLPSSVYLAAGYLKRNTFYLKTIGGGVIFLRRGNDFAKIIEKDNSASGYIEGGDMFIFTTTNFVEKLGGDFELRTIFDHKNPTQIVDEITPQLKGKEEQGIVGLFIRFEEKAEPQLITNESKNLLLQEALSKSRNFLENFRILTQRSGRKKTITFVAVIVILLILVWSVVLGYKRRSQAEITKKIKNASQLVTFKLDQAEEIAFLNLPRSLALISEARQEVEKLKKQLGNQKDKEVSQLEQLIKNKEGKIVKKEEKNYEEFFDLTVDAKEAKGNIMYLDDDTTVIADNNKKTLYILSLTKKSLDKRISSDVKSASLIGKNQSDILVFVKGEGIFLINEDNKSKKVIENDKDWGSIKGMFLYNGNIYLLDDQKGDIYKYVVTDNGYSGKTSYLKGEVGSVKGGNSLAIDSSVYVGFSDRVTKFTAGGRDEFSTSWPEEDVSMTKIFTNKDVEKVYGWDKDNGAIYILGKNGTYERQIKSSILAKADDFIVYNNSAYILVKEKIYKIALE